MIDLRIPQGVKRRGQATQQVGTFGRLTVFLWTVGLILLAPPERMLPAAGLCLIAASVFYPSAFRRLLRVRWLLLLCILALPPVFLAGDADRVLWGVPFSSDGLATGSYMVLRALVILIAVDGFSNSVDIAEVAGLLERAGLRGLGFSMGVAVNLLPGLYRSSTNAWRSLWMRGGLRRQRLRGLQLLLLTVISNAIRRAEGIALAAEARAYSPDHSQASPLKVGSLDWLIVVVGLLSLLGSVLIA